MYLLPRMQELCHIYNNDLDISDSNQSVQSVQIGKAFLNKETKRKGEIKGKNMHA